MQGSAPSLNPLSDVSDGGVADHTRARVPKSLTNGGCVKMRPRKPLPAAHAGVPKPERPSRPVRRRAALRRDETAGQVRLRQAYGGTSRPDKCLVVKSLDSSLRRFPLRNMESTAIITRDLKAWRADRFWGSQCCFPRKDPRLVSSLFL
jgi:hypothetical protein